MATYGENTKFSVLAKLKLPSKRLSSRAYLYSKSKKDWLRKATGYFGETIEKNHQSTRCPEKTLLMKVAGTTSSRLRCFLQPSTQVSESFRHRDFFRAESC